MTSTGVTTGMIGHGEYNRNSAPQMVAIDHVMPWLDDALSAMPLDDSLPDLGLADFGCSEGRNSIAVMQRAVDTLRARTARPIQTIHSDLPTNDFTALLTGLRPDGHSVFGDDAVFSSVVGGSMFDRLLPPRSLHLATTFNAIAFFSRRPLDRLPGHIVGNGPSGLGSGIGWVTGEEHAALAAQSSSDLEAFLQARADELVPGGKLLMQVFGTGLGHATCDGFADALNDALLEMVDDKLIDRDHYEVYYHPTYFRTLDELVAPVAEAQASCAGLFSLERSETYEIPVPFVETFRETDDAERFAREFTAFFRVFSESPLRLCLANLDDVDNLIDDVYVRAERLIRDDPRRHDYHFIALAALLTRRDGS
ncbi:MAG: hypothetical protein AAF563_16930 [Pseudomonadota bacterium]